MKKILLVEDNRDILKWWQEQLIQLYEDAEISCAINLAQAREHCARNRFTLALIDLGLPDGSGMELLAELNASNAETYCVVTTIFDDDAHIFESLRNGAKGYLIKDQPGEQLVDQLRQIAHGQPPLSPSIARRILNYFTQEQKKDSKIDNLLTPREKEVLTLITKGHSRPQIAKTLNLAPSTVCGYSKAIYQKLNVSTQAEAAVKAIRIGLLDD